MALDLVGVEIERRHHLEALRGVGHRRGRQAANVTRLALGCGGAVAVEAKLIVERRAGGQNVVFGRGGQGQHKQAGGKGMFHAGKADRIP
ncbi:hypothetical protein [Sinisalibacter lacisalsi]|uniref:Uncharacterized protein n=1 Tax=Sinisalibacter lacisalsi TaxID=1526570 RepID=A0ABQ1QEV4_9RHOB|nr:hypothetical protein [Sinisalibacter lacisalsi]GGD23970.1 hypothetical protein GCM10011358_05520 [Sinisalibacter lacisalsi]